MVPMNHKLKPNRQLSLLYPDIFPKDIESRYEKKKMKICSMHDAKTSPSLSALTRIVVANIN